ncbi:hypothetical protein AB0C89_17395 [Streptomyces sp. NPDC048491]|uniref:hypothetical protein n=1 Tax=Streptomyces sp. NPDC048491 TaxID=3157207 RepID=UPI003432B5FB
MVSHRDRELAATLLAAGISEAAAMVDEAYGRRCSAITVCIGMASDAGSTEAHVGWS